MLDAMDEAMLTSSGIQIFDLIPPDLHDGVYFIVSSRESSVAIRLRARPGTMYLHIHPTSPENLQDAEDYVAQRLSKYALDGDLVHRIAVASEGNFLILEQMVSRLIAGSEQPDQLCSAAEQMLQDPWGRLDDFYASAWDQIVRAEGELELKRSAVDALGLLSIAQSPMRMEDIALILGQRQFETELAIERIRPFLEVYSEESLGAVYYQLHHSTFGEFVRARLGDDLRRYHIMLIQCCQEEQPSTSLQGYRDRYLSHHLSEHSRAGNAVAVASLERFRSLLTPEMAQARRSIDGNYSAFVRDLGKAIEVAKQGGIQTFPELIEFCFIKSHIFGLGRVLPADTFAAIAVLDGLERAKEAIETIGDRGHRACAYASLVSVCPDRSEQELLAQKALDLARQSGRARGMLSTYCSVGMSLIRHQPRVAVKAFQEALESVSVSDLGDLHMPTEEIVDQFVIAYEIDPKPLSIILPWMIKIAKRTQAIVGLLNLAYVLYTKDELEQSEALFEEAWEQLGDMESKIEGRSFDWLGEKKYLQEAQETYLEVLALVGKIDLAKDGLATLADKVEFGEAHLLELQRAAALLEAKDFNADINLCNHPVIRRRAITGLLVAGSAEDVLTTVTRPLNFIDLRILIENAELVVKRDLYHDVLQMVKSLTLEFWLSHTAWELIAALAKELACSEPDLARSLVDELYSAPEPSRGRGDKSDALFKALKRNVETIRQYDSYRGDVALLAAIAYRKGDLELGAEAQLAVKELVEYLRRIDGSKASQQVIPAKLKAGWDLYELKDWDGLRDWISQFEIEKKRSWSEQESAANLTKALAESGQMSLARSLVFKLGDHYGRLAHAHIDAVSLRTKIDLDDLIFDDEDTDVVLIRAQGLASHSPDLACSYVRLFGDWLLAKRQNDEYLIWKLSRIAHFLYEHGQYAEARKCFLLGYEHAIRTFYFENSDFRDEWQLLEEGLSQLSFEDQFPIIQELIILCGSYKSLEVTAMVSMFADVFARNLAPSQLERIFYALERSREWLAAHRDLFAT